MSSVRTQHVKDRRWRWWAVGQRTAGEKMRAPRPGARRLRARVGGFVGLLTLIAPLLNGVASAETPSWSWGNDTRTYIPEFTVTPLGPGQSSASPVAPSTTTPFPRPAAAAAGAGEIRALYSARVPEAAKPAVQSALDRWAAALHVAVPVEVNIDWVSSGSDNLVGAARPSSAVAGFPGAGVASTFYPVGLANQLAGIDLLPDQSDIDIIVADRSDWDYTTAGAVGPNRISLATVVLHEVLHGLGFATTLQADASGIGFSLAPNGTVGIFDRFVIDRNGTPVSSLPNSSAVLGAALTQGLSWQGVQGTTANGGRAPALFSPFPFQPFSSIIHLDEATYPTGHPDSISTPLIVDNEAVYSVGTIAPAMLADMGWALESASPTPSAPVTVPAQPPLAAPAAPPVTVPVSVPLPSPDPSPLPVLGAPPATEPQSPADSGAEPVGTSSNPAAVPTSPVPTPTGTLPRTGFPTTAAGALGALAVTSGGALLRRSRWSRPVSRAATSWCSAMAPPQV